MPTSYTVEEADRDLQVCAMIMNGAVAQDYSGGALVLTMNPATFAAVGFATGNYLLLKVYYTVMSCVHGLPIFSFVEQREWTLVSQALQRGLLTLIMEILLET